MKLRLSTTAVVVLAACAAFAPNALGASAPLPAKWPFHTLELGARDPEGGAAALRSRGRLGFRYHYLSGGVNTGGGWTGWAHGGGSFASEFINDSKQGGFTPVFSYYQLYESAPARGSGGEQAAFLGNLRNPATMRAYYEDLKLFFQKAGAFPDTPVVLHVEPDAWGWMEKAAAGDHASTVPASVASSGQSDVAGLPDTAAGFAQAIARLRDRYAPNVLLGYHLSVWGTGDDPAYSNPPDATIDELAAKASNFFTSLGPSFDVIFGEYADRDSGYRRAVNGAGPDADWDAGDFARNARFLSDVSSATAKRIVLWQIPFGNTRMRAVNNTRFHYQDNKVEWLLDDPSRAHVQSYLDAGVIAFLFGTAVPGTTCACDAAGDGLTNPLPIAGNLLQSLSSDDDGGFFFARAGDYYSRGALPLPGSTGTSAKGAKLKTSVKASPKRVRRGKRVRISTAVKSDRAEKLGVKVSIYRKGRRALKRKLTIKTAAGKTRKAAFSWRVPSRASTGKYTVRLDASSKAGSAARKTIAASFRVK